MICLKLFKVLGDLQFRRKMKRQKVAILAKLYDYHGDMDHQWYIYFSAVNPMTGKMQRFKLYKGLNVPSKAKRYQASDKIITETNAKLQAGWSPWADEKVIYEDNLKYHLASDAYKFRKAKNRTWNYVQNEFLSHAKGIVRVSTYQTYQSKFRIYNEWLKKIGSQDHDISTFNADHVKAFLQYLKIKRGICGKGLNEYIRLFRQVNKQLIKDGKLNEDPWALITKYKHTTQTPSIFTDELIIKIKEMAEATDPQLWIICRFIFYCFIRPRELRFLKIKHIDWHRGVITVPGTIAKNRKTQSVVIPQHFLDELKEKGYHKAPKEYYLFSTKHMPDSIPVGKNYMFNHFDKIRKDLNIPHDYKFYSWKHSGGVQLKQSGVDIIDIKNQFRHHSLDELFKYLCSLEGAISEKIKYQGPRI